MAKSLLPDPLTAEDLNRYLGTTSDFALEVEIYRQSVLAGLNSEHGGTYQDQNSKKDRQFDVRATAVLQQQRILKLAVECKNLQPSHPLLVHRLKRSMNEAYHEVLVTYRGDTASHRSTVRCVSGHTPFFRGSHVGKALNHVGKIGANDFVDADSAIYDKWTQAIASSADWLTSSTYDFKLTDGKSASTVILPILLVSDQTLWVVDYDDDGSQLGMPSKCDEVDFYIGKNVDLLGSPIVISHFKIFTKKAFFGFLSRITSNDHYLDLLFPDFARYHGN